MMMASRHPTFVPDDLSYVPAIEMSYFMLLPLLPVNKTFRGAIPCDRFDMS